MASQSNNDELNHWFRGATSFWKSYLAGRPTYPQSYIDKIISFHRAHGNAQTRLAHDLACGPGNVAESLGSTFDHVVASDISPEHVEATAARLSSQPHGKQKFSVATCKGEDLFVQPQAAAHWNGKTDLVTAFECIILMDAERALSCFETLLAPGGTAAISLYGRPILLRRDDGLSSNESSVQDAVHGEAQSAFDNIVEAVCLAFGDIGVPATEGHALMLRRMAGWCEYFRFDEGAHAARWRDVTRLQWNADRPMSVCRTGPFVGRELGRTDVPEGQAARENVVREVDRTFWVQEWDEERLWRFVMALKPSFEEGLEKDRDVKARVDGLRAQLRSLMDGKLRVSWPVTLIMAVKA